MGGMVGTSIDVSLGVDMIDWAIGRDPKWDEGGFRINWKLGKVVDVPDGGGGMMGDSDGYVEKNI
jgi:hypothetical protein